MMRAHACHQPSTAAGLLHLRVSQSRLVGIIDGGPSCHHQLRYYSFGSSSSFGKRADRGGGDGGGGGGGPSVKGSSVLKALFEVGRSQHAQEKAHAERSAASTSKAGGRHGRRASDGNAAAAGIESEATYKYIQPLACPGGNRMTSRGVRTLMKVNSGGQLKTLGQRFVLNLKLTHQVVSHLDRYIGSSASTAADTMHTRSSFANAGPGSEGPATKHRRNLERWNSRIRQQAASESAFDDMINNTFKVAGLESNAGDDASHYHSAGPDTRAGAGGVSAVGVDHRVLIELGPGPGALSRSLLTRRNCGVLGIEIDMRFNPYLQRLHQSTGGRFQWMNADVLEVDEMAAVDTQFPSFMALKRDLWKRRLDELQRLHFPGTKPAFIPLDADAPQGASTTGEDEEGEVLRGGKSYYGGYFSDGGPASTTSGDDSASMFMSARKAAASAKDSSLLRANILARRKHMGAASSSGLGAEKKKSPNERNQQSVDDNGRSQRPLSPAEKAKVTQLAWESTDSMANDSGAVVSLTSSPVIVFANLPFSITTEMLVRYAIDAYNKKGIYEFGRTPLFVFLQKEVADRLVATPLVSVSEEVNRGVNADGSGTVFSRYGGRVIESRLRGSNYSRPTVFIQNYFTVKIERVFSEETFYPKTEVLGALVHLRPRPRPLVDVKPASLFAFLNAAFKGRMRGPTRPALRSLSKICPPEVARFILESLRIDGATVPLAQLSVTDLATIALLWETYVTKQAAANASSSSPPSGGDGDDEGDGDWDVSSEGGQQDDGRAADGRSSQDASSSSQPGAQYPSSLDVSKSGVQNPPRDQLYETPLTPGAAQRFFADDEDEESEFGGIGAELNTGDGGDFDSTTIDLTGLMDDEEESGVESGAVSASAASPKNAPQPFSSSTFRDFNADGDMSGGEDDVDTAAKFGELNIGNVHLHAQDELRKLKALRDEQQTRRRR